MQNNRMECEAAVGINRNYRRVNGTLLFKYTLLCDLKKMVHGIFGIACAAIHY